MVAKYSGLSKVRWRVWTVKRDQWWSKKVCQLGLCIKCTGLEGKTIKAVEVWGCFFHFRVSIKVFSGVGLGG